MCHLLKYLLALLSVSIGPIVYSHPVIRHYPSSSTSTKLSNCAAAGVAPQIFVDEPLNYSVARPMIHFRAKTIAETDSCRLIISVGTTVIGSYLDSVETELDLSRYEGNAVTLAVQATDKNNQTATGVYLTIYVESSPYLQEYYNAPGIISDFNYNRLLVNDNQHNAYKLIDIPGGNSFLIPYRYGSGSLTPQGAVFMGDSLLTFNNGVFHYMGITPAPGMKIAGNYGIWTRPNSDPYLTADSLFLTDFAAGTHTLITGIAMNRTVYQGTTNAVSDNGTVVYVDSTHNLVKYVNNTYAQMSSYGPPPSYSIGPANPLTDGYNIAYQYIDHIITLVKLVDQHGETILTSGLRDARKPFPYTDYQVKNKYTAYINTPPISPLHLEIWVRDSLGNSSLAYKAAGRTQDVLDLLGDRGDVMYFRYLSSTSIIRELATWNNSGKRVCSNMGKSYYCDANWYVAIGRTLFILHPDAPPDLINNGYVFIPKDSLYDFRPSDFTGHFAGPGQIISIKITGLPKNGTLRYAGIPVKVNDEIVRADIGKLSYTPDTGFTATDTLQWNASDGIGYTASDARLAIRIVTRPVRPQLSGLDTAYCMDIAAARIKIANFPDTSNGTRVNVRLDNEQLQVAASDSSFSVYPAGLSVGVHTIITIFQNVAGAVTDTQHFTIHAVTTPLVKISANITNVTDLSNPVVLTAGIIAGGGTNPVFEFAKDNAFLNLLQERGSNNQLVITPGSLIVGDNRIYVRMTTSEACYAVRYGIDSIDIVRGPSTGITDTDFPDHLIGIHPNPFKNRVRITGLSDTKNYIITIYQVNGQPLFSIPVKNQVSLEFFCPQPGSGIYLLSIFDEKKGKILGTVRVLKE